MPFSRELWIDGRLHGSAEQKATVASKGMRAASVWSTCSGFDKDASGNVTAVHCDYYPDSKSGTPGSDSYKVRHIHWVAAAPRIRPKCASTTGCSATRCRANGPSTKPPAQPPDHQAAQEDEGRQGARARTEDRTTIAR